MKIIPKMFSDFFQSHDSLIKFHNSSRIKFHLRFREISVYLQGEIYQKVFIGSLIFSQKSAVSNIFLPKSLVFNFGNNYG